MVSSMKLLIYYCSIKWLINAELDYGIISPITDEISSRRLKQRQKPSFGGRLGLADPSALSQHKNRIKNIGVQLFPEDALETYQQKQSWKDNYDYDSSIGYHWFGKSNTGIGTMNMLIREYKGENQTIITVISGSIANEDYVYNFHTEEDGLLEVIAVNVSNFPKELEPRGDNYYLRRSLSSHNKSDYIRNNDNQIQSTRNLPEDGSRIDVICFYTRKALCKEANQATTCNLDAYKHLMDNKCALAALETNIAFQNSGVLTKLRLVFSGYIDATQSSDFCSNLYLMFNNPGPAWVQARDLRNLYKADLMHMIIDNDSSCGCGDINGWVSVSDRRCTTGHFSFAHELGHNFGCLHDPMTEAGKPCSKLQGTNYGYQDPASRFRSIMAYDCNQAKCPRLQYFSTPNVNVTNSSGTYNNAPIGSYCSNNVKQINSALVTAANYMNGLASPTNRPSTQSSHRKSRRPSTKPSRIKSPTRKPSKPSTAIRGFNPTLKPINKPSSRPIMKPSMQPNTRSTTKPSLSSSLSVIKLPSTKPSAKPFRRRTRRPSLNPSFMPSTAATTQVNPLVICSVRSTSCSVTQVRMILRLDRPSVLSWALIDLSTNQNSCSGGPYSSTSSSQLSLFYCLQKNQKLKLQLRDIGIVGFPNSVSTYNVTIGFINTGPYYYFTKNNGQSAVFWRGHTFAT